ncbi:hypothetical protein [Anaerosolibacter carboniphilus]|uniref:hypothetical protein n=1 Tax=Anaerosolibacter carboniphilus TaxID=1417629 RepID=UPI001A9B34DA|nr:hypothetical protein [Anaerosolibacter carboniphilus]
MDIRRGEDRRVNDILKVKTHKTAYVIEAILSFEASKQDGLNNNAIKQALREVLGEININIETKNKGIKQEIPEAVFNIFEQI